MKTEINIEDYLSHDEIKSIVGDQLRASVADFFKGEKNANRLLGNLAYQIIFDEVDKIVPNSKQIVIDKVTALLHEDKSYQFLVFRDHSEYSNVSPATQFLEEAVRDNSDVIRGKVLDAITNRDYTDDVWKKFEELGENFVSNIYGLVALGRAKSGEKNP